MTMRMTTVEARDSFADLINRAAYGKERIILTRRGKDVVAIVPLEDVQVVDNLEQTQDLQDAMTALKIVRTEASMSLNEFKGQVL